MSLQQTLNSDLGRNYTSILKLKAHIGKKRNIQIRGRKEVEFNWFEGNKTLGALIYSVTINPHGYVFPDSQKLKQKVCSQFFILKFLHLKQQTFIYHTLIFNHLLTGQLSIEHLVGVGLY